MTTFCRGEKCPVRKQCTRYTAGLDEKRNGSDDRYILQCRNQRMFTNEDLTPAGGITGISQETADDLAKAFADLGRSMAPLAENLNKFVTNVLVNRYGELTRQFLEAKYKSLTKSIFTRWWWKRKADKLSEQVDKLGELIDQHIEKGGDQ